MKTIKNKEQFFKILENELLKHFSVKDSIEVLEDYKMFYKEKEDQGANESDIILGMETPHDIVRALINEGVETTNQLSNILISHTTNIGLRIVWIGITILFLLLTEFSYVSSEKGIILLIIQILGFWLIFSYRKFILNKYMKIDNSSKLYIILLLLIVLITYGCIAMMYKFSIGPETTPFLDILSPSQIGPLFHYIIMISIVVCLSSIYLVYYRYQKCSIHIIITFLGASSVFLLISLHARLGKIYSMEAFAFFVKNQLITYSVVSLIGIIIFIVSNRNSLKEKML